MGRVLGVQRGFFQILIGRSGRKAVVQQFGDGIDAAIQRVHQQLFNEGGEHCGRDGRRRYQEGLADRMHQRLQAAANGLRVGADLKFLKAVYQARKGADDAQARKEAGQVFEKVAAKAAVDHHGAIPKGLGRDAGVPALRRGFGLVEGFAVFLPEMGQSAVLLEGRRQIVWAERWVEVALRVDSATLLCLQNRLQLSQSKPMKQARQQK